MFGLSMNKVMRKIFIISILILLLGCNTTKTTTEETEELEQSSVSEPQNLSLSNIMTEKTSKMAMPDQDRVNIIFYILQNTQEVSIHQMRGETENVVYVADDGREAVYDGAGNLVTNSYNKGSYNLYDYTKEPIKKFMMDTLPWLELGNDPSDPTTKIERLYYYTYDLNLGIQTYIFEGRYTKLQNIDIGNLSDDEINTYKLFNYIIFNDGYEIKFVNENMKKLQKDADYYWDYFYQIHELFGIN